MGDLKITQIGYYYARIYVELIEAGKVYAVAIEKSLPGSKNRPTSYQIANGLLANNMKLDTRYVRKITSNQDGKGEIVFDELKENTNYNICLTIGNNVPYEPADLIGDDSIVCIEVRTLKNPSKNCFLINMN